MLDRAAHQVPYGTAVGGERCRLGGWILGLDTDDVLRHVGVRAKEVQRHVHSLGDWRDGTDEAVEDVLGRLEKADAVVGQ